MDEAAVRAFFDTYLEAFGAAGRGQDDLEGLLACYDAPLLLTTPEAVLALATAAEVEGAVRAQVQAARDGGYASSEVLELAVEVLSPTTALVRGRFVRRRADDSELARLAVTYVVVARPEGLRMASLLVA